MANIDIQVPDIGDFDEVTVIELIVKGGDHPLLWIVCARGHRPGLPLRKTT
jgi:hypothetical protein